MVDLQELLWGFSVVSFTLCFLRGLREAIYLASSGLNSSVSPLPPPLSWVGRFFHGTQRGCLVSEKINIINLESSGSSVFVQHENPQQNSSPVTGRGESISHEGSLSLEEKIMQENACVEANLEKSLCDGNPENKYCGISMDGSFNSSGMTKVEEAKGPLRLRNRPARLVVPEYCAALGFDEMPRKLERKEFEVEGRDFFLVSKKGRREVMEDSYTVMLDIFEDPKQAFFGVIDGHGGRAAADYTAEKLGKNIIKALETMRDIEGHIEEAIREGFLVTDREFLSQGVSSGACAACVLLKNGELNVANVGDCRVILSRNGVADTLTNDHRASREDERLRIQNSGGFVHCYRGVWRVQGTLAVSRAIGDLHLKQWIISEPETRKLCLTPDSEFLIIASDGLWDEVQVKEQEAVDVVLRDGTSLETCRKLVSMSSSRGSMDDISVMLINLQRFLPNN